MDDAQSSAILAKAEALNGGSLGDSGALLVTMAAEHAMAFCGRQDVPMDMETAVAQLALDMADGRGLTQVNSVTRGDTSVTYGSGDDLAQRFAPWRRLRTVTAHED
jgi:hypothetical protein